MRLIAGSRRSPLAVCQTRIVIELIRVVRPELDLCVLEYETSGDVAADVPIDELDPAAFTDGLERALLDKEIDIAVHSYKDLPYSQPAGLVIAAVPVRADAREALVSRDGRKLSELPPGSLVGVSSKRRAAAVCDMRPDIELRGIRGSVDLRVRKVQRGEYDATVLAVAGLERLGLIHCVTELFDLSIMPPAAGQGALAVQCRRDDVFARKILREIDDCRLHASVDAERCALSQVTS